MRTAFTRAAGSLVLVGSVTGIVFVTGMRAKSPAVVNGVRKLGRAMRPLALRSAGGRGHLPRWSTTSVGHRAAPTRRRWRRCRSTTGSSSRSRTGSARTGSRMCSRVGPPPSSTTAARTTSTDRRSFHSRLSGTSSLPPINGLTACSGLTSVSVFADLSPSRPTRPRPDSTNETPTPRCAPAARFTPPARNAVERVGPVVRPFPNIGRLGPCAGEPHVARRRQSVSPAATGWARWGGNGPRLVVCRHTCSTGRAQVTPRRGGLNELVTPP